MLSYFKKSILLSILLLVFTSCASKKNGKYHTKYSYHPYYSLYAKKMSNDIVNDRPKKTKIKMRVKTKTQKTQSNPTLYLKSKSRFPTNN